MTATRPPPSPVPFGQTARRVEWAHLPRSVRQIVETRIGAPVVAAVSQGGGYTPGFASVLTDDRGIEHFVKAAAAKAQRPIADSYREEARKLGALPVDVPAPRLLWSTEVDGWFVLATEHVAGSPPARPWRLDHLHAVLDLLEVVADRLSPVSPDLALTDFAEENAGLPGLWEQVVTSRPGLEHGGAAAALAARLDVIAGGDTVVHGDVRDDNLLLRADGSGVLCDWNWPSRGAAWLDSVMLMIGPRGDGLDVDALLSERRLTRDVPSEDVDALIAVLTGYFWWSCEQPESITSPYLRAFQRWQGDVCWGWLAERRGWS